jgi:hypothetical protein
MLNSLYAFYGQGSCHDRGSARGHVPADRDCRPHSVSSIGLNAQFTDGKRRRRSAAFDQSV